jgi:hypothetical protein
MDEKQLQFLFNEYAKGKGFKDYNEFKSLMSDDNSRRIFFDESNKELGFKDFADFDNTLGLKKKSTSPSPSSGMPSESVFGEIEKTQRAFDADPQAANRSIFGFQQPQAPKAFDPFALEEALTNTAVTDKASRNQVVLGQGMNENIPVRVSDQLKSEAKKFQEISDRMIAEAAPVLEKAIKPFLAKGLFTDKNGNVSDAMIDRFALTLSKKWGMESGVESLPYVKEFLRGFVKNKEEAAVFQQKASKKVPGQLQKILGSKLPTAKLAGKDVPELSAAPKTEAEYIKTELDKAAAEQANLLIQTANSQNKTILQEYKKQEAAVNQEYEPLFKSAKSQEEFNALAEKYYTAMGGIKDKANRRLQRQQSELNKSIQSKLASLDLPEAAKKNLQDAWLEAGKEVQEEDLKGKKAMQDAFVEQFGFSGLFGKSLASSLLTGLASRGDGLVGIGMGGQVADWLRTFREPGLELETVDLELKGQNWYNPQTYITRLGKQLGYQAPGMIASFATGNPFLGGIIGWGDENLQNAGETYSQVLSETNNPMLAQRAAKKYLYTSAYTIPLYFVESEMFLRLAGVKKGGNFFQNTAIDIPIENIQEGIQGYTGQLDYKDAKTLGAYLKKDFPDVALETTITTVLQNALFAGVGKVGQSLAKKKITPEEFSRNYVYNLVANKGLNTAFAATELKFANGLISKEQLAEWKSKITEVASTVETLKGLGLSDEQVRGYVALQAKRDELQNKANSIAGSGIVESTMRESYQEEIEKINEELKKAALGKVPSTTVTFPSGGSVTITGDEAKQTAEELKGEAGTTVDVTTTEEAVQKEIEEVKKKVPEQTNDELFDKMTDLQQMFYENGVEARVDDNGVVTVQDMNGQEVDIDILPDDVINGINEYKDIFKQLRKEETPKAEEAPKTKGDVGVIGAPQEVSLMDNLNQVVTSIERLRGQLPWTVTQDMVVAQMAPITDQMASIEKEFAKQGFIIDVDYDTVVIRKDSKEGQDYTQPEDLPKPLQKLAAEYEMAALELLGLDETSFGIALQKSKGVTEDVPYEEVSTAKDSDEEGKPLGSFGVGDIVYTNYPAGKKNTYWNYTEYKIEEVDAKGNYKLKDVKRNVIVQFPAKEPGFILKEKKAEETKTKPKNPKTNTAELDKALEDFIGEKPKGAETKEQPSQKEVEADIENRVIITGTDGGFVTIDASNFKNQNAGTLRDIKISKSDERDEITYEDGTTKENIFKDIELTGNSYAYRIKRKNTGKVFYVVGISNRVKGTGLDSDRNGDLFASVEDDGNLPSNIRTLLELRLIKEFEKASQRRKKIFAPLPQSFIDKVNAKYEAESKAETPKAETIAKRIRDNIKDLPEKDLGDAEANKNWNDIRESRKTIKAMSDVELLKEVQKGMDGKLINQAIYESYFGMDITAKDITKEIESLLSKEQTPKAETSAVEKKLFSETDAKGRTRTIYSSTKEKDGIVTTKFLFNRSDKEASQRNAIARGIPLEKALGEAYTIDEEYIPEGAKIVGVLETRIGKETAGATVAFETNGIVFQGEVKLTPKTPKAEQPSQKEKPKPIKQLGTGDNVYFENDYYRVNDTANTSFRSSNRVILNVYEKGTDKYATVPLNSFYFSTVEEAMYVAEELNKIYPKGVPAAVLLDKIVNDLQKKWDAESKAETPKAETKEQTPSALRDVESTANYFDQNTRSTQDSKYNPDLSGEGEMALREQESRLLELGADRIQAHGLVKGSIGQQFKDLLNILTKGLDSRGGGQLYTAPLVLSNDVRAGGSALGTAGGTAYIDGGFIILARAGVNEIRSIDDIGGVLVNQAVADSLPELVERLKKSFPNISIESYSNASKAVESLLSKEQTKEPAAKAETKEQPSQDIEAIKEKIGWNTQFDSVELSENELRAIVEKNADYFKAVKSGAIGVVSVDFGTEDGITYMDTFDKNGKKGTRYYVADDKQLTIKKPAAKAVESSQPSEKQPSLESAPVVRVPVSDIKENVKEYQGRKNKFSERSAANVAKNFDINKFDPIVVFKHPDGNTYVLSGHSRLEGMRRRGEKTIPARFFTGTTEEAKEFALKSNKLGTLQTDLENAAYYREAMQKGKSFSSLMSEAKETEQEGTATRIMDYAMLNPKGKAYQALESLEGGESDSSTNVKIIAQKVGRIRAKNDHLTDAHENELFDYFLENGYPTDKDVNDPANVLNRSINAVKFDPQEPLNLSRIVTKSPERAEWERELKELESQLAETNKQVTPDKKTGWTGLKESIIAQLAQGKTQKDIDNAEKRFNENAGGVNDIYKKKLEDAKKKQSVLKDKLAKHKLREKSLIQGEKSQTSLFDTIEEQPQTEATQFASASGEQLEGELIEIPGYEKLDFIITQDGMSFKIYDLVTGMPINKETYFSKEEAIANAQEFLKDNFTPTSSEDSENRILNALYKNSLKTGFMSVKNQSKKFQDYVKKREQKEKQELESLPFLHNEQERQMLLSKAEEAKTEGLNDISNILTSAANRKQRIDKFSGAKVDEQRANEMISEGKKKKLTEEERKNQQPLTFKKDRSDSEEAFKETVNNGFKTDRLSQLPADVIKRGYQAFKKEIAIRNKYGYYPSSFTFNGASIVFNRYLIEQKSKDAARIKKAEAELEDYIESVNELYDIEFPKSTPKADAKTEPKKEKRKIRDEKLKKDIDDALDDLFGSSSITLTSFGIDPERLEKGVKIIGLYTKAGLYKFKDIAEDLYEKYGEKLKNILEEIKAVYAYYRIAATKEEREQMDVDVADFTYEQIAMGANEPDPKQDFIDSVESKLISKERQNIITLRKLAQALELEVTDQELQEYVELAIVNVARKISMNKELTEEERFEEIKDLYQNQPTISMRSSERIEKQQYSTPVPISFTAGMFAQTGGKKTFLDPSAGNGMLLINVDGSIQANEIDRTRSENLERQGFDVTNLNGEEELPFKVDSVLTNPPFGGREKKVFGEFNVTGLAPQMAINALNTMKDDGTAVVIVGGHAEYDERGVLKGGDRAFLNYLYQYYNVIDVINVDGSLYAKQGTSFPIRMILIGGRRSQQAPGTLPGVREIKRAPLREDARAEAVKSFDELYNRVKTAQNELLSLQKVRKYELGQKPLSGVGNVGGTTSAGNTGKDTGVSNQPVQPSTRPAGRPDILGQPGGPIIRDSEQLGNTGNVEGLKEQSVDKVNIEKVQGGAGESLQLPGRADERIKEIEEAKNVRYEPGSKSEEIGSVVPANMAAGIRGVLSQFPDVDDFVRERLGYKSKEELFSYLSAEQVDGVAIAISQIENNKAVIIGDMTGVGKGRQAAAIIRYAVKQGLKPVFMTEKAGLFSDIYRDLINIGSGNLKPFIVNDESEKSDPKVYVDDGTGTGKQKVLHRPMQRKEKQAYYLSGALPKNVDFVLITYSQLAQEKVGKDKRNFFRNISIGNVLILDESHNASGEGKTGQFLQSLLPTTKGVTFLSATYSKNPDTMAVYGTKTSISEANMTQSELISAVKKGGAVLQEILSKQLTEIGEYVRRERDFEGVVTTWETAGETPEEKKVITDTFDSVADVLRSVLLFQRLYVTPAVKQMNEDLKNQQGSAGLTKGTVDAGVSNTPFASKVFNITRQLMFSLKAEKVAEAAIDEIKKGNKVVIAVSNTMEGFLEELDFEEGLLSSADYTVALQKALTGVMRYTVKSGGNQTTNLSLNVSQLSPEGQAEFRRISKQIKEITTGITISPIDVIKSKIQNAGYTIAEITGRSNQIIFNEEGRGELKKRKTDKKEAETGFTGGELQKGEKPSNNSKYNAVVLNMSGSTGISLHASKTFRDQRPRVMIMAQMQLDVNTEIQVRGRIDRTGQVSRGRYRYILSPIPAENRLAMMFIKKLKSLSANTSGSQETKEDAEIVNFLDKYGDEKVLEYLKESTEINAALSDPLKLEGLTEDELEKKTVVDNAAHITSGRVALLSVKQQQDFYDEIASRYTAYIASLDANNENDLKAQVLNLKAKTLNTNVVIQGKNNKNPFSEDSVLEEVEMDNNKFPLFKKEIDKQIQDRKDQGGSTDEMLDAINEFTEKKIEEEVAYAERTMDEKLTELESLTEVRKANAATEQDKEEINAEYEGAEKDMRERYEYLKESRKNRVKQRQSRAVSFVKKFVPGQMYLVPLSLRFTTRGQSLDGSSPGVFIGFALRSKTNLTPSNISARFAVLDSRRVVDVPLSQSEFLENVNKGLGMARLENWDEERKVVKSRRKGYIITGNILQAANYPGKIIKYTTEDGQIKDGILMPDNFDPAKVFGNDVLVSAEDAVEYFLQMGAVWISNPDVLTGNLILIQIESAKASQRVNSGGKSGIKIYVSKSKSSGGKFYLNEGLRNFVENRNFVQKGNDMVGTIPIPGIAEGPYKEEAVVEAAKKLFAYLGKEFGLRFPIDKQLGIDYAKWKESGSNLTFEQWRKKEQENAPKLFSSQKAKKSISEIQFNELVNRLSAAFPQAKIITKEEALQKPGGTVIKTAKGVIYGLAFPDGSIYLNSEAMSAEAAIHEFSHLWEAAFPQEWKNGIELMRKSSGFQKALAKVKSDSDYAGLTPGEQESEALNMIIGKKGEGYFRNEALSNFKAWLRKLFVKIADKLGLGNLINPDTRFEQFTDKVIGELLNKKAKTFTTSKGKPKLSSQQSAIDEFDNIMQSKNVVERQNMQYDFIKKYGVDKFKKLRDITLNFDSYVDQLEKDNYIKDKLC